LETRRNFEATINVGWKLKKEFEEVQKQYFQQPIVLKQFFGHNQNKKIVLRVSSILLNSFFFCKTSNFHNNNRDREFGKSYCNEKKQKEKRGKLGIRSESK
jgi:hypothetical protein